MEFNHKPVLLAQCIEGLAIKDGGIYVDGTIGGAGHSREIVKRLDENGLLIGIDRDTIALDTARKRLQEYSNVRYIYGNHDEIKSILQQLEIPEVDGILLDLGVSSYQIDTQERGFSYRFCGELDMRMDVTQKLTAKEVVNTYLEEELIRILYEYGEEKFAKQIARKICQERKKKEIQTTLELVKIIEQAIPYWDKKKGHPAKKTFQAIRIEVNDEITPLYHTILDCIELLKKGGRLCVITFHSLEDRAVKNAYQVALGNCTCSKELPYCVCGAKKKGHLVNKKPIVVTKEEQEENSRAKSAKLRIFEKE